MFHLFVCDRYERSGGMSDYKGAFATLAEAKKRGDAYYRDLGEDAFYRGVVFVGTDGTLHEGWTRGGSDKTWQEDAEALKFLSTELRYKL